MILANTKANGYSLGLPLFWSQQPERLSTGMVQAISITLAYPSSTPASSVELFITKYAVTAGRLSLTIANDNEIICYLDAPLSDSYTVYKLEGASSLFMSGVVGIYPQSKETLLDLTGAQINPLYVYLCPSKTYTRDYFKLYGEAASGGLCDAGIDNYPSPVISGSLVSSAALAELVVSNTANVTFTSAWTSGALIISGAATSNMLPATPVDSTSIYTINGNPISGGGYTINLPDGWIVRAPYTISGAALCAQIGNTATETSCPGGDPVVENLGPQNFAGDNPLALAFSTSGGIIKFDPASVEATRFNAEYEEDGLRWCEFSTQHDATTGGCVDTPQTRNER